MSPYNKVIWSEGLFLRPQHLQQNDRYLERLASRHWASNRGYGWGFVDIKLNRDLLKLGRVAIASASGVMKDGTPFNIPDEADHPIAFEPPVGLRDIVYLALPIFQPDSTEIGDPSTDVPSRYSKAERLVVDYGSGHRESAMIEVARLRFALLPGNADRAGYACLPIAKLIEVRNDRQLVLDEDFLPPVLDCHASQTLSDRLSEVQGMLRHRGEALAGRLAQSGTRGVAEIADYLLLQAINRYEPLFDHFSNLSMLHPEDLYRTLVELAGELSTYARPDKRPTPMGVYKHDDSSEAFAAVMLSLRESLRTVLEQTAVQVALRQHRYGVQVADVGDRKIFTESSFVLAVRADVEAERLRRGFPSHIKIGPASKIKELVNVALPGIAISALPVAPRQIPFHVGVTYFEIDRKSNYWKEISQSGALALHVAGDFPNLDMALWAIKGQ